MYESNHLLTESVADLTTHSPAWVTLICPTSDPDQLILLASVRVSQPPAAPRAASLAPATLTAASLAAASLAAAFSPQPFSCSHPRRQPPLPQPPSPQLFLAAASLTAATWRAS